MRDRPPALDGQASDSSRQARRMPGSRTGRTLRCGRAAAWTALLLLGLLPARVMADRPTYALDEDPIRLGSKALEQGRLSDAKARFLEAVAHDYQVPRAKYGLAEIAVREGRYDDAEPFFREALARRQQEDKADYPEARAGLGLLLLRYGRDQEAAQEFQKALQSDARLWEAQYGQARLLLAQQQWEEAKKLLDQGAGRKGAQEGEDEYHYGLALYWLGKNNLQEAEKEALFALHLNAWDPDYGTLVGRVYEKRNAPTLAIDAFETALQSPGMTPTAPMLCTLGALYQKVGRYNEARDRYFQAVAVDSTYAPALKNLADLFRLAKQYDRAARTYLRYIMLEHDDIGALLGLAESCIEIRQYEQAVEAARAAMALDDTSTDVRLAFARSAIRSRDIGTQAEAARAYANLPAGVDLQPQDYIALADYQTEMKQYPQARQSLNKALALDPNQANAYFQLGVIDLETGQPQAAITHLEKAISLKPDSPIYYLNLGIANFQAQRLGQAIPMFRKALQLNEGLTVGRLLLAQALAVSDSLAGAEVAYQKVLDVEPRNAKALRGLGFCHIRRADYREAVRIYQAATAAEPQNADGWAGLGNAYLGLENWEAAEGAFRKAEAIDPNNITMRKGRELLKQARQAAGNDG
jgi:tetratricopeptide (TPR) repeat protein